MGGNKMNKDNEFIAVLGEAYWEDSISQLLEKYEIPKTEPKEDDYDIFSLSTKSGFLKFSFDDDCETDKQKSMRAQGNLYLQGISFTFGIPDHEEITAPFEINEHSTYESISKLLGHADFQAENIRKTALQYKKIWRLKKEDNTMYHLICNFKIATGKVNSIFISTYNSERKYRFVKNELLQ